MNLAHNLVTEIFQTLIAGAIGAALSANIELKNLGNEISKPAASWVTVYILVPIEEEA